jgi:endonuclease YncB( thermonuclease family)
MLGWRKRSEGFEWEKYVRTTIKVRRADRRQKAARLVADVGARARSAGVAVRALPLRLLSALGRWLRPAMEAVCRGVGALSAASVRRGGNALARLDGAGGTGLLALTGVVAFGLAVARVPSFGLDGVALGMVGVGALALLVALAAGLAGGRLAKPGWPARFSGVVRWPALATRTGFGRLPAGARGLAIAGVLLALGLGVAHWVGGGRAPGSGIVHLVTGSLPSLSRTSLIEGRASAIAGDMLRVADRRVRLTGIEAPELAQRCRASGGKPWRCGITARAALAKLVAGKSIRCQVAGDPAPGGETEGTCAVGGEDLGALLVRAGHVFADEGSGAHYAGETSTARASARGLWQGGAAVERPTQWRRRVWSEAARAAPEGCPIKGRITAAGKQYVLPWQGDYERARVLVKRGGRWFCSEEEARAAGFRAALGT